MNYDIINITFHEIHINLLLLSSNISFQNIKLHIMLMDLSAINYFMISGFIYNLLRQHTDLIIWPMNLIIRYMYMYIYIVLYFIVFCIYLSIVVIDSDQPVQSSSFNDSQIHKLLKRIPRPR